jgi:hypothetical protein
MHRWWMTWQEREALPVQRRRLPFLRQNRKGESRTMGSVALRERGAMN